MARCALSLLYLSPAVRLTPSSHEYSLRTNGRLALMISAIFASMAAKSSLVSGRGVAMS